MSEHQMNRWQVLRMFLSKNTVLGVIVALGSAAFVLAMALLAGLNPGIAVGLLAVILTAGAGVLRWWNGRFDPGAALPIGRSILSGLVGFVVVMSVIQAVPYGRDRSNPPVTAEPVWDSPRTRELAVIACFDCHSNEVEYPWYSQVAPFSWAVQNHVEEGREQLNFSEWDRSQREADEAAETVYEGSMPPLYYLVAHPSARLTDAEKQELAGGFKTMFGSGD